MSKVIDLIPRILEKILNSENIFTMNREYVNKMFDNNKYTFKWIDEYAKDGKRVVKVIKCEKEKI